MLLSHGKLKFSGCIRDLVLIIKEPLFLEHSIYFSILFVCLFFNFLPAHTLMETSFHVSSAGRFLSLEGQEIHAGDAHTEPPSGCVSSGFLQAGRGHRLLPALCS